MHVLILGAGAGGGVPQWNSNSEACRRARAGERAQLTQSGLAVSADGRQWVLLNASPDLRQQIAASPALHPVQHRRHSPIVSVVLTNGDVDHVAGLLTMREGHSFSIYATEAILETLQGDRIFGVLDRSRVGFNPIEPGVAFDPAAPTSAPSGLRIEAFEVPGKVALYLEEAGAVSASDRAGVTVGLRVSSAGEEAGSICYVPGCAAIDDHVLRAVTGCQVLLFDGTLWRDDEMIRQDVGTKSGRRMGHVSMSGPDGAIARLAGIDAGRKVFVHINNTNPVLLPDSPERAEAEKAGWEIGYDGMEIRV